ncbi:MAG TPA: hypothetical protein VE825_12290 [Terriglobales bacterium]|nr:hypothetical protein [Terriglobales bacterium]
MRHPIAIAALATSSTVLVAALRDAHPPLFFFAFGIACFALAAIVRDSEVPASFGPLFWVTVGAVQLAAFGAIRQAHPADPALLALAALGFTYLLLGTVAWLRERLS